MLLDEVNLSIAKYFAPAAKQMIRLRKLILFELHSMLQHRYSICDLLCINQPSTTNFSFEKNSRIDFELSLLIDYTSYHYEIFSVSSTEQDFYRD